MSMREYPCGGYIINVRDLTPIFPQETHGEYEQLLQYGNIELIEEFIDMNTPDWFPAWESIYSPSDEDSVNEGQMEQGEVYLTYTVEDFFELKPKECLVNLLTHNVSPLQANWSVFG